MSNTRRAASPPSKVTPLLLIVVFVIPVLAAYLFLKTGIWQQTGSTEHGQLLSPVVATNYHTYLPRSSDASSVKKGWLVISIVGSSCNNACKNSLMLARQSLQLLGPERHRVQQLILQASPPDKPFIELLDSTFGEIIVADLAANSQSTQPLLASLSLSSLQDLASKLIVIDPMGNAMLAFTVSADEKTAILSGKGFVKDLKKLLKMSRIG